MVDVTPRIHRRLLRLGVCAVAGLVAAAVVWTVSSGHVLSSVVVGWTVAALLFVVRSWTILWPMSAEHTKGHAQREDPGRGVTDVVLLLACVASVVAVGALLLGSEARTQAAWLTAAVGVAGVVASWCLVPTVFAARYADLHYSSTDKRAIDFGDDEPPTYSDFAYLAVTLGMTYQVSDTALRSRAVRRVALVHSLLSYFLGVVVIGCTVNLIVSLASRA